jgi:D-alanine-D-alanine ligase
MTRVGILFGGPSAEHNVSCSSALAVVRALPERYQPVVIGIERDGRFRLVPPEIVDKLRDQPPAARAIDDRLVVDGQEVGLVSGRPSPTAMVVAGGEILATVDVVFPVLHGPFGEDGVLQGFLETLGVPYVGCGVAASAIGMNKVAMKRAFRAEDIPVTPYLHLTETRWRSTADPLALVEKLAHPLFVKPANMGSSIGISMVRDDAELAPAVERALAHDHTIMIEQGVRGREIECSVLGGFEPRASAVGEVTVTGGWFDYEQKYFADADPMIVPAELPARVAEEVRELSVRAFHAVGCWGLARVDFLYDEAGEALYVNELNTMPGFTPTSAYPKMWEVTGVDYPTLLATLIDTAIARGTGLR